MVYSLNDIEHGVLRGNQKPHTSYRRVFAPADPRLQSAVVVWDPRVQFALVRAFTYTLYPNPDPTLSPNPGMVSSLNDID